jgi:hypothetical protein
MLEIRITISAENSDLSPVIVKSRKALEYKRSDPKGAYVLEPFFMEQNGAIHTDTEHNNRQMDGTNA